MVKTVLRPTSSPDVPAQLEQRLLSDLRQASAQGVNTELTLELREDDSLVGGLVGSTSYGWLLIKILWVAPSFRKQGYGRDLIEAATTQAKSIGCHSVWLDTSDETAMQFYQKIGFEHFGMLENRADAMPIGHRRYFMKMHL